MAIITLITSSKEVFEYQKQLQAYIISDDNNDNNKSMLALTVLKRHMTLKYVLNRI